MKNLFKNWSAIILLIFFTVTNLSCEEKQAKVTASNEVEFLFVQNADSVVLKNNQLWLKNIAQTTLYFSDRPDRIVGRITTQKYVDHWAVGDNNFKSDPPNAVISVLLGEEVEDITIVLKEPRLEGADLVYNVAVLNGSKSINGGAAALFIDVIGRPLTPLSVSGVARRTARRTVRRKV